MGTIATKSKKATRIESALLNKLALMGQKAFARAMGVPEYQVSRWKNGFFSQVSMMLAVLEYGIEDDEMAELTKRLADYLTKEKAPKNGEFFEA
ncbi:lambda phage CII family protein [Escherichia coli]|nr:lambda phage CII family protein [Escherichia coli]MCV8329689.1 lambda phage CII family protein [Escherichia coli]